MGTKSMWNKQPVDIVIPTMDNMGQLMECVNSIYRTRLQYPMRFILVNNGHHPLERYFPADNPDFLIVNPGQNLGWTGGIAEGLRHSTSEYVMFCNAIGEDFAYRRHPFSQEKRSRGRCLPKTHV